MTFQPGDFVQLRKGAPSIYPPALKGAVLLVVDHSKGLKVLCVRTLTEVKDGSAWIRMSDLEEAPAFAGPR